MSGRTETNVRLPWCAVEALAAVGTRRGTSQDATLRQLLGEHVEFQEDRDPDDRLTHISTVLRYPPPPRSRHEPRPDRPVRLRAERDLLERARAVSLSLPGQHRRSHRDYQARVLTDAVMTAIAAVEPFTDEALEGLLPLLRHRAALGLWRLTTAETSTGPERALLVPAETIRSGLADEMDEAAERQLLLAAEALEEEVGWHSPARFDKTAALARRLLTGPDAATGEQLLYEQGPAFQEQYQDALQAAERPPMTLHNQSYDWTGRGGTAVWRAHRTVAVQDFEDWLTSARPGPDEDSASYVVNPPAWILRTPPNWHAHTIRGTDLTEPYTQWVTDGRLLTFPYQGRLALWPMTSAGSGWEPVSGIEPLAAAARAAKLRSEEISGFIEAVLIDWSHEYGVDSSLRIVLDLPADLAHRLGFLTSEQQHAAMAEARAETLRRMDEIIEELHDDGLDELDLQELREARDNAQTFRRLATRHSKYTASKFRVRRATWQWPGPSVAEELLTNPRTDLVQALAVQAYRSRTRVLEEAAHEAWQQAFDRYARRM
ncbi:hypothetical protein OH768_00020 [Streptomyces sp. NBC_01622]|uniref:hypothetical protein n=1 Tax=Streptomyces sp. NBC_01622 TaxID=2975903 RepID=UPI00386A2497|nr:hypothetical protein OH768_00020 [Streptomyces sp. NBC_01622]